MGFPAVHDLIYDQMMSEIYYFAKISMYDMSIM